MAGVEDMMLPVQRVEMASDDIDVSATIGHLYARHRPRVRRIAHTRISGSLQAAATGVISAGTVDVATGREQTSVARDATLLFPLGEPFICGELVSSGVTEVSSLVVQEMTRHAASALLATFPNTTMTIPYLRGPGRVPPAAARRAAEFIDGHACQPLTLADIAAQAGVTPRALQYAFRRQYDTAPMSYLRRVRLERAHQDLLAADPVTGNTVAATAGRWGFSRPDRFAAACRTVYGRPPSHTLRR